MRRINLAGWLLAALATTVYVLTLEPTVSFWDCGEFIAVSYGLQVGHPPGAPLYQLLAHLFCLLAGSHLERVAYCCNLLSAISAGLTVMFLYWTAERMMRDGEPHMHWSAVVGALCYLFCHSAWFSAVESEVYSLAMLVASIELWAAWRWRHERSPRWICLIALLAGMGICVHFLTLLTLPAIIATLLWRDKQIGGRQTATWRQHIKIGIFSFMFFLVGISPYAIIPLRAAAHPTINSGNPENMERLVAYLSREQYEKAPLYPRMWRHRESDDRNMAPWSGGDNGWRGNLRYYVSYQLGYMYGRYLCDNFIARQNQRRGTTVWYVLPVLLALAGLLAQRHRSKMAFWSTLLLFLTAGPLLNFYLNHPCYEPRERDYAYVLSFYAVTLWISEGALLVSRCILKKRWQRCTAIAVIAAAPALMAWGNWDDHNRSGRWVAHDTAMNILNSCDNNALLFTFGDNDTFPLWYVQQVERQRTDIQSENINLIGYRRFLQMLEENINRRPCYLSQYAYDQLHDYFDGHLQLEGMTYRVMPYPCAEIDTAAFLRHERDAIRWHDTSGVFIDNVGRSFLKQYESNRQKVVTLQSLWRNSTTTAAR